MTLDERYLSEVLAAQTARLGIAGAQAAVWDGSSITEACTGFANAETGEPVHNDTLFQIGSTTKLFAAAVTMQLVDEGRVDLDQPIISYLPDFQLADAEATQTLTLRHLHSMSSGLDNGPYADHGPGNDAVARYVTAFADVPQMAAPGSMFGYSNASTTVAGRVTEVLTGQPWEEALRERFLIPAGLDSTRSLFGDLVFHRIAVGHARDGDSWKVLHPWSLARSLAPAGSTLCATATDLVRFGQIMLRDGRSEDGNAVLSPAAVQTMRTPVIETPTKLLAQAWCVGSYRKQWDTATMFGHSGTNLSSSSMLLWAPEHNVAIASIANVPPLGYPLAYAVFGEVLSSAFDWEAPKGPQPDPSVQLDAHRYSGQYAAYGVTHEIEAETESLRLTMRPNPPQPPDNLAATSMLRPLGHDRFLPEDVTVSGGRGWDVAFVGDDGTGRATHFVNGVMAARRIPV